jgi:tripartite ATP-independent transporter DctP family solute receptor
MRNRFFASLVAVVMVVACGGSTAQPSSSVTGPSITLIAAHDATATEAFQTGFDKFAKQVTNATNGTIKVKIFPNGVLGDQPSVMKAIQSGSVSMSLASSAVLSTYVPELHLYDLPFLITSRPIAYKVLDGSIGESFAAPLEAKDMILLGYYDGGVRNIINSKRPVNNLSDFKGMKIRVIPSAINLDTFQALGANPVPLDFSQLYTALQSHVVDAAETNSSADYAQKFYEVAPHYAQVQWLTPIVDVVVFSKKVFDSMSKSQQTAVRAALRDSLAAERQATKDNEDTADVILRAKGVQFTKPDRGPWIDAVKPVWAKWAPTVGQKNIDAVLATKP